MKTCRACGCYIPDLWGVCPGCGAIEAQKSDSVGRSAPERKDDRSGGGGNGGSATFEILDSIWERERVRDALFCSMPKTVLRRQDGKTEDLELLDEPDAEIITRAIAYRGLGGNDAIQESSCFTSTPGVWSSDPNVKPYPIELEHCWPWSEIKLHQGTNK